MSALILAGSRPEGDPLAIATGVAAKALIDVDGQPMLARVVNAVRAAGIDRIAVSATAPEVAALAEQLGCDVLKAQAGPSASTAEAFRLLGAPMLLTTADHALLDPDMVRQFLSAHAPEADLSVLLARREAIEAAAPGTRRSYLRMSDGEWSGCNLFYFATPAASAALDVWGEVEADRKRPWRIAARLGLGFLCRHMLGLLGAKQAITELGKRASIDARLVESPYGLAAVDVDKPADLALARALAR